MENKIKKFNEFKDDENKNESILGTAGVIFLTFFMIGRLLKWLSKILIKRMTRKTIKNILDLVNNAKKEYEKYEDKSLSVSEFNDRWYIRISDIFNNMSDLRILKDEKILLMNVEKPNPIKIKLTDDEYNKFLDIIIKNQ